MLGCEGKIAQSTKIRDKSEQEVELLSEKRLVTLSEKASLSSRNDQLLFEKRRFTDGKWGTFSDLKVRVWRCIRVVCNVHSTRSYVTFGS